MVLGLTLCFSKIIALFFNLIVLVFWFMTFLKLFFGYRISFFFCLLGTKGFYSLFFIDGSSDHVPDLENGHKDKEKLVVPEKASSFKVHPERVCKDECSYCFGKFGMYDTPLHIAQIKHIERQNRILASKM